jgi:hypothetical protein
MLINITAIIFQPDQGEVVSWCASLLILVEQRRSDENDALVLRPHTAVSDHCGLVY